MLPGNVTRLEPSHSTTGQGECLSSKPDGSELGDDRECDLDRAPTVKLEPDRSNNAAVELLRSRDIAPAVIFDVERQIVKRINVVVPGSTLAKAMILPRPRFVPMLA